MKKSICLITLCCNTLLWSSQSHATSPRQEGVHAVNLLAKTLKTQLKEKLHLDDDGASAMSFCISQAQILTQEVNTKLPSHIKVRRTSLALRNKANTPDMTDIQVMRAYKKAVNEKKSSAKMMQEVNVGEVTRVYKPLFVGKACLKCHGETLSPTLKTSLHAAYPEDNATGLHLGQFRGVIVSEVSQKH